MAVFAGRGSGGVSGEPARALLKTVKRAKPKPFNLTVEFYRDVDGRWLADIPKLPGVTAYGRTKKQALVSAQALALRVIADRLAQGEAAVSFAG